MTIKTELPTEKEIREAVRARYAGIALKFDAYSADCCGSQSDCCNGSETEALAEKLGYSQDELSIVPPGSNLGLGCGNPIAFAHLKGGETVLDLGSGAGFDCFLAAKAVGEMGRVIGVDMTYEMLDKARHNAQRGGYRNVDFRLGEIEHLPIADNSVDQIISNCVINLVPDKAQVFRECFRVLRIGGRLSISDVVTSFPLPDDVRRDLALHAGCLAGATLLSELEAFLAQAGFSEVKIEPKDQSREFIKEWAPDRKLEEFVTSALIQAVKR
jgi:arsenite methyltransferase